MTGTLTSCTPDKGSYLLGNGVISTLVKIAIDETFLYHHGSYLIDKTFRPNSGIHPFRLGLINVIELVLCLCLNNSPSLPTDNRKPFIAKPTIAPRTRGRRIVFVCIG